MPKKEKKKRESWTELDEYLFQLSNVEKDRFYNEMMGVCGASGEEMIHNPVLEEMEAAKEEAQNEYEINVGGVPVATIVKKETSDRGAARTTRLKQWLLERYRIIVQHGLMYVYSDKGGCYVPYSCEKFLVFLEHILPEKDVETMSTRSLEELRKKIERCCSSLEDDIVFNGDETKINFLNGVVSITDEGIELLEHSDEWYFSYVIRANFVPHVAPEILYHQSPTFKGYTQSSFADDLVNKTSLWLCQTGYCLSDSVKGKAVCFWIGAGDTGKSVMSDFVKKLLGEDAVSSISIQELNSQFSRFEFFGKKLNIVGEMSNERIKGIDVIKSISGSDMISAAQKGEQAFFFEPRGKLLYAGNTLALPYEADPSEGFYNRLKILFFNTSIPKDKQDPGLSEKLWTERDNIASMAVHAFRYLHYNKYRFPEPESSRRYLNFYRLGMDSTKNYAAERLQIAPEGKLHLYELYEDYLRYCKDNGLEKKSSHDLQNYLITQFPHIEKEKFRKNGSLRWGIVGLDFASEEVTEVEKNA